MVELKTTTYDHTPRPKIEKHNNEEHREKNTLQEVEE